MENLITIIVGVLGLGVGAVVVYFISSTQKKKVNKVADQIIAEAKEESERIKKAGALASKEEVYRLKEQLNHDAQEERNELKAFERRLLKREDALDHKVESLQRREKYIENLEKSSEQKLRDMEAKTKELTDLINEEKKTLYNISGLNKEEATRILLSKMESELQSEIVGMVNKYRAKARETTEGEAKKVISLAIQRCAAEHTAQNTVSTVDLPNEDMKGRIIGREGRNIRAFEKAAGVDVIVDDTPGVLVISSFDSVKREIARRSMEKLIIDGRIHPGRIEEIVEATRKEVEDVIQQTGKQTCYDLNILNINPKLVTMLGRLRFRTSYGQNILQHSIEVAYLTETMASELKLNPELARRCGLLHDIGKATDQVEEGTHPGLGAELARRCEERPEIVDAIEKHHDTMNPEFVYTVLVAAADAISAARPGARRETVDKYIKRLERLEAIATAYQGVENAFAIQAGREIRVIVNSGQIDDSQATIISRNIANDIEKELKYPGEIKVTVVRETRAIEYAR
ncbi:MAG: ribonuclease Y [Candidatus Brocadiia bacterium]